MRKTQQSSRKTSFKGVLNLQNQKLPQKKSRSRSIRDKNITTNQYAYSRATQNDNKSFNERGENENTNRKLSLNNNDIINGSRIDENRSNLSRNENSIEKVRQNMRKQSQQIKQRQRNRSNSRRKRSQNRSKQNSISHHVNRFPNAILRNTSSSHKEIIAVSNQNDVMGQIINLKNNLNTIEKSYSAIGSQLGSISGDLNSSNYQNQSSVLNEQQELKQKANDLNNILESFHIRFKENFSKTTKELLNKIDQREAKSTTNKENVQNNSVGKQNHDEDLSSIQINLVFNNIEKQFGIGQYVGSNNSLFERMKSDGKNNFRDLQKRLALTQERILK